MEISRDAYLQRLVRREGNGLVKIVTGARRCGKSYLLCSIFRKYLLQKGVPQDRIISVALDDRTNKELRDPDNMLAYLKSRIAEGGPCYIILDEVQLLREFVDVLNSLLHIPNADVYVTGSNSRFLSSDVATEFRGRGDEVRLHPLTFSEYLSAYKGSSDEAWDDFCVYGGLPLILSRETAEEKAEYLLSLFGTVYLSDIVERHNVQDASELGELVDALASAVGSLTNPIKIANTFRSVRNKKITGETVAKYIGYLEDAFLVNKAARYDIKGRKYIGAAAKYYFEDVGLRNARLGFRQIEENRLMENIIYNELRARGFRVDVGAVEIAGRAEGGSAAKKQLEVDFVAARGSEKRYIQSAFAMPSSEKREQETRPLNAIGDSFKKIIVVAENIKPRYDEKGIVTVGLRNFLLSQEL